MVDAIRPLTADAVRESARAAAEQHIPHAEANPFELGSELWRNFMKAYLDAREVEVA